MSAPMSVVIVEPSEDPIQDPAWNEQAKKTMADLRDSVEHWQAATMRTGELLETVRLNQYYRAEGFTSFSEFVDAHRWDQKVCDQIEKRYRALCAPAPTTPHGPRRRLEEVSKGGGPTDEPTFVESDSGGDARRIAEVGVPPILDIPAPASLAEDCRVEVGPERGELESDEGATVDAAVASTDQPVVEESATDLPVMPSCEPPAACVATSAIPLWTRNELATVIDTAIQHAELGAVVRSHHCVRFLEELDHQGLADFWDAVARRDFILEAARGTDLARRLVGRASRSELEDIAEALTARANDVGYEGEYDD